MTQPTMLAASLATPLVRWCGLLLLCGAYLQGGFSFFEHFGLVGAFLLVAWYDLRTAEGSRERSDQRLIDTRESVDHE